MKQRITQFLAIATTAGIGLGLVSTANAGSPNPYMAYYTVLQNLQDETKGPNVGRCHAIGVLVGKVCAQWAYDPNGPYPYNSEFVEPKIGAQILAQCESEYGVVLLDDPDVTDYCSAEDLGLQ